MPPSECGVCCEGFNKSTRKKIQCNYCEFDVCVGCTEKYLLDCTQDPHCMNCRHAWNRENMETYFTKKFYTTDYKKHREDVMFQRQLSMMPETQQYVERERTRIEYAQKTVAMNAELKKKKIEKLQLNIKNTYQMTPDERIQHAIALGEVTKCISNIMIDVNTNQRIALVVVGREGEPAERRQFIRACPADGCKGFLSTQWKCGLCKVHVCNDCHEIKKEAGDGAGGSRDGAGGEHVCSADNLATAKLLAADSKACPKCASMIFKIEGCSQIWCTVCHTAFDWRTGKIETGVIHNPHYYEYQRQQNGGVAPRVPGDIPGGMCGGGVPNFYTLNTHVRQLLGLPLNPYHTTDKFEEKKIADDIGIIHRMHGHIQNVELHRFAPPNVLNDNRDLRVRYMLNSLSDAEFKTALQQREKANDKKREITMVLQTYQAIIAENLTAIPECTTAAEIEAIYKRMVDLREYINDSLERIAKRYANVAPFIAKNWGFSSTGIEKRQQKVAAAVPAAPALVPKT